MVDDADLVARVRGGDARAFEQLVERYEKPVFNAAYRILADYEDAADVTQTVFLKVHRRLGTFDRRRRFFSWLYRIAVNEAIDLARKRRRELPLDEALVEGEGRRVDHLARIGRDELITSALRSLKMEYRVVIVLKYFLEMSYREIAETVGLPVKTVKSRLYTGREMLREALLQRGYSR